MKFSALLILSILLITHHNEAFADIKLETADEYRISGYEEQQKGNYKKALEYYTKSLSLAPDNPVIFNDMGVLYEQLGIDIKAEEYYLRAIRVNRDYLPPYTNVAYLFKKNGDTANALIYFKERYKRSDPDDPWRIKVMNEMIAIDPNLRREIKQQEGEKLLNELIEKVHEEFALQIVRSDKHYHKGLELLEQNDYEQAIIELDRALALTPKNPKVIRARERAELEKVKDEVAQRTSEAMEKLNSGEAESAKEEFRKILTIIPGESKQESE